MLLVRFVHQWMVKIVETGARRMRPLEAKLKPIEDLQALGTSWRDLESRGDRTFFLSWTWIGSWLETLADNKAVAPS